jgi:prevent-host-death family protein
VKTASVGEIQKNFGKILREIKAGEQIIITKRGSPIAKLTTLGPKGKIDWPDFFEEAVDLRGKPASQIIVEDREERF